MTRATFGAGRSNKLLRLAIATFVTGAYAVTLAQIHPNRDALSHNYALGAQLVLSCCFVCGTLIKVCEEDYVREQEGESSCATIVGLPSSWAATLVVVGTAAATLLGGVTAVAWQLATAARRPTLRLVTTGEEPALTLPSGCSFYSFISHAWGSPARAEPPSSHAVLPPHTRTRD